MVKENATFSLSHVEEQKKVISDIADEIHTSLVVEGNHGRCHTDIFEQYFLPIFLGETGKEDPSWHGRWIELAYTLANKVDIINSNGDILFTVPPLLNTSALKDRRAEDSLPSIMNEYNARNGNVLANATTFLMSAFGDTYNRLVENYDDSEVKETWREILKYYGKLDDEGYLKSDPNAPQRTSESTSGEVEEEGPDSFLNFD